MTLRGRAALVTGGASGIGRAIAEALAREGARVAVLDRNGAGAGDVAAAIESKGGTAGAYAVDIPDVSAVNEAVTAVAQRWNGIDALVNCAGWDQPMPFIDTTPEFWDRILAINLRGPIAVTPAVLKVMVPQADGKVIFIASDAGRVGSAGSTSTACARGRRRGRGLSRGRRCPSPAASPWREARSRR